MSSVMPMLELCHIAGKLEMNDWLFQPAIPESSLPVFKNLKVLQCNLVWLTAPVLCALIPVLQHCPTLEKLSNSGNRKTAMLHWQQAEAQKGDEVTKAIKNMRLFMKDFDNDLEREMWDPSKFLEDPGDSLHHLKVVSMEAFIGTRNEVRLLEYLLGKAGALEKLIILDFMGLSERVYNLIDHISRTSQHLDIHILQLQMKK